MWNIAWKCQATFVWRWRKRKKTCTRVQKEREGKREREKKEERQRKSERDSLGLNYFVRLDRNNVSNRKPTTTITSTLVERNKNESIKQLSAYRRLFVLLLLRENWAENNWSPTTRNFKRQFLIKRTYFKFNLLKVT